MRSGALSAKIESQRWRIRVSPCQLVRIDVGTFAAAFEGVSAVPPRICRYYQRRHTPQRLTQPLGPHTLAHAAFATTVSLATARRSADAAIASARCGANAATPMTIAIT